MTPRRGFLQALSAAVISVAIEVLPGAKKPGVERPWTPELPRWEVVHIAQPKNISWGHIQPFQTSQRVQIQIPPWYTEAQRRQVIADAYHFPVDQWDLHAPMFGIRDRPKA